MGRQMVTTLYNNCAYCACRCFWYPKVAPFKCMLTKSRGVLFLSVQKFEALLTGIRFDKIRTASLLNGFKTLSNMSAVYK